MSYGEMKKFIYRVYILLVSVLRKTQTHIAVMRSVLMVSKIKAHLKSLAEGNYKEWPDICFVFQTFNKGHLTERLLKPFIKGTNIILFADGCIDKTLRTASRMLTGKNHLVISANNCHEIRNYRLAVSVAGKIFGCKYAMLLQDDDVYDKSSLSWIKAGSQLMDTNPGIAVIGFNAGFNPVGNCSRADQSLTSAKFETFEDNGKTYFKLGEFETCEMSDVKSSKDGSSWGFCSIVNRAPTLINIEFLNQINGGFPQDMEPYQYDDYWYCLKAWSMGWKVVHMPISSVRRNVDIGGMRLINNVTRTSRPVHFINNWNKIHNEFKDFWGSAELQERIKSASVHKV